MLLIPQAGKDAFLVIAQICLIRASQKKQLFRLLAFFTLTEKSRLTNIKLFIHLAKLDYKNYKQKARQENLSGFLLQELNA